MPPPPQPPNFLPQKRGVEEDYAPIDFTRNTTSEVIVLPIPKIGDTIEVLAAKLAALNAITTSHKSLAVATNYKNMAYADLDAVAIALEAMTPDERNMYGVWTGGEAHLPEIDWETMRMEPPTGQVNAKRRKNHVSAIRIIWNYPAATAEHLAYMANHLTFMLPLIKAVARIENLKKDLRGNHDVLSAEEWAEMQCVNQVHSMAMRVMERLTEERKRLLATITASTGHLQARERALKEKFEAQEVQLPQESEAGA